MLLARKSNRLEGEVTARIHLFLGLAATRDLLSFLWDNQVHLSY